MFACTARGRARARGACVPLCWLIRLLIVRRPSLATKNVTHAGDDVVHGPAGGGGGGGEGPYRAAIGRDRRTSRVRRVYDVWRRRRCVVRVEPRGRRGPRDRRKARSGGRRDRGRCGNRSNDPGGGKPRLQGSWGALVRNNIVIYYEAESAEGPDNNKPLYSKQ